MLFYVKVLIDSKRKSKHSNIEYIRKVYNIKNLPSVEVSVWNAKNKTSLKELIVENFKEYYKEILEINPVESFEAAEEMLSAQML